LIDDELRDVPTGRPLDVGPSFRDRKVLIHSGARRIFHGGRGPDGTRCRRLIDPRLRGRPADTEEAADQSESHNKVPSSTEETKQLSDIQNTNLQTEIYCLHHRVLPGIRALLFWARRHYETQAQF